MANTAKAMSMLKNGQKTAERASKFFASIKRDIEQEVLVKLDKQIEKKEDEIFELENIFIDTDKNAGRDAMTKEQCQANFMKIMDLKFEVKILKLERESKGESFAEYFG